MLGACERYKGSQSGRVYPGVSQAKLAEIERLALGSSAGNSDILFAILGTGSDGGNIRKDVKASGGFTHGVLHRLQVRCSCGSLDAVRPFTIGGEVEFGKWPYGREGSGNTSWEFSGVPTIALWKNHFSTKSKEIQSEFKISYPTTKNGASPHTATFFTKTRRADGGSGLGEGCPLGSFPKDVVATGNCKVEVKQAFLAARRIFVSCPVAVACAPIIPSECSGRSASGDSLNHRCE